MDFFFVFVFVCLFLTDGRSCRAACLLLPPSVGTSQKWTWWRRPRRRRNYERTHCFCFFFCTYVKRKKIIMCKTVVKARERKKKCTIPKRISSSFSFYSWSAMQFSPLRPTTSPSELRVWLCRKQRSQPYKLVSLARSPARSLSLFSCVNIQEDVLCQ